MSFLFVSFSLKFNWFPVFYEEHIIGHNTESIKQLIEARFMRA